MADNENAKYKTIKSNLVSFNVAKGIAMPDTDSPTFKEQVMAKLNDTISNQSEIETTIKKTQSDLDEETKAREKADKTLQLNIDEAGHNFTATIDKETYIMTFTLLDKNSNIKSEQKIDLPIESLVMNGSYDKATKSIVLTLQSGTELKIPVEDLIQGLATQEYVDTQDNALQGKITAEAGTRAEADKTLQGKLTAEETARTTTDNEIKKSIETLTTDLTNEKTAREKTDETLQTNINKAIHEVGFEVDEKTYKITLTPKDKEGNIVGQKEIDLPVESLVMNVSYVDEKQSIIITLQNGETLEVPVSDLIKGLATTSYVDEKDKELQDKITAETTAREKTDNELKTSINTLTTNLTAETKERKKGEQEQADEIAEVFINFHNLLEVGTTEFKKLNNLTMPIGFIFEICDSTYTTETMTERYGGAWEEITGFTFGAGSITEENETFTFNVGDTGGEVKHTLTKAEMPAHQHRIKSYNEGDSGQTSTAKVVCGSWTSAYRDWWNGNVDEPITEYIGGDTAHNNMPPYLVVRKFKRTALFVEETKEEVVE